MKRLIRNPLFAICVCLLHLLTACSTTQTITTGFYQAKETSPFRIPLKVALINANTGQMAAYHIYHSTQLLQPALNQALLADLRTIFPEVTLVDRPQQAGNADIIIKPSLTVDDESDKSRIPFHLSYDISDQRTGRIIKQITATQVGKQGKLPVTLHMSYTLLCMTIVGFPIFLISMEYLRADLINISTEYILANSIQELHYRLLSDETLLQYVNKNAGTLLAAEKKAGESEMTLTPTTLCVAAQYGDAAVVKRLLQDRKNANVQVFNGWTPLLYATAGGHADVASLLLNAGARPDTPGPDGSTPLMIAALTGNTELTKVLLAKGARTDLKNNRGLSAIDIARTKGQWAIGGLLIKAGRPAS